MTHPDSPSAQKLLHTLLKLSKKDMVRRLEAAGLDISPLQYWVLTMVKEGPTTLIAIAREFDVKPPTLIPSIDALEKEGYLERQEDASDRRKVQLLITKKGSRLTDKVQIGEKHAALHGAVKKLGPKKEKQLILLLQELIRHFPQ